MFLLRYYSPWIFSYQPTAGLTWTGPQTEVKDHLTNLRFKCGQQVESPAVLVSLDLDYSYKSVIYLSWHWFTLSGIEIGAAAYETVTLPLRYGGGKIRDVGVTESDNNILRINYIYLPSSNLIYSLYILYLFIYLIMYSTIWKVVWIWEGAHRTCRENLVATWLRNGPN